MSAGEVVVLDTSAVIAILQGEPGAPVLCTGDDFARTDIAVIVG